MKNSKIVKTTATLKYMGGSNFDLVFCHHRYGSRNENGEEFLRLGTNLGMTGSVAIDFQADLNKGLATEKIDVHQYHTITKSAVYLTSVSCLNNIKHTVKEQGVMVDAIPTSDQYKRFFGEKVINLTSPYMGLTVQDIFEDLETAKGNEQTYYLVAVSTHHDFPVAIPEYSTITIVTPTEITFHKEFEDMPVTTDSLMSSKMVTSHPKLQMLKRINLKNSFVRIFREKKIARTWFELQVPFQRD